MRYVWSVVKGRWPLLVFNLLVGAGLGYVLAEVLG